MFKIVILVAFLVVTAAFPRDETEREDDVFAEDDLRVIPLDKSRFYSHDDDDIIKTANTFARVPCAAKGPEEDAACEQHCASKGYQRGLCVNYGCNCV